MKMRNNKLEKYHFFFPQNQTNIFKEIHTWFVPFILKNMWQIHFYPPFRVSGMSDWNHILLRDWYMLSWTRPYVFPGYLWIYPTFYKYNFNCEGLEGTNSPNVPAHPMTPSQLPGTISPCPRYVSAVPHLQLPAAWPCLAMGHVPA